MRPRNPYEVRDQSVLQQCVESSTRITKHTTRSLAEVTGFSHATISHIVSGRKKRVSLALAQRLSAALGKRMDELFVPSASASDDAASGSAGAPKEPAREVRAGRGADAPEEV